MFNSLLLYMLMLSLSVKCYVEGTWSSFNDFLVVISL